MASAPDLSPSEAADAPSGALAFIAGFALAVVIVAVFLALFVVLP